MRSALGSIQDLGDGRKRIFVDVGRDSVTGRRTRKSKVIRGSYKEAERVKLEMLRDAGHEVECDYTLAEYVENIYLPSKQKELKRTTYEGYRSRLFKLVLPALGEKNLAEITSKDIKRTLSAIDWDKQRIEAYRIMNMVFQHAIYEEDIEDNPMEAVRRPKDRNPYEPEVLDAQDVEVYLWHFRDTEAEVPFLLALGGGFRRGEICALNVEDINFSTGAVKIDDAYVNTRIGAQHSTPKSRNGYRTVHLPRAVLERLSEILPPSGPVMTSSEGERIHPSRISHIYEKVRNRLPEGVPRIPLKNLRHTSLTLAYDSGADILDVSNRAGHANVAITSKYYVRPRGDRDTKTAEKMDKALKSCDNVFQVEDKTKRLINLGSF